MARNSSGLAGRFRARRALPRLSARSFSGSTWARAAAASGSSLPFARSSWAITAWPLLCARRDQVLSQLRSRRDEANRLLPALAQPLAVAGEPGARLLNQRGVDCRVEDATPVGDALVIEDVELRRPERGGHLVLNHFDLDPVAGHVQAVLDRIDLANIEPDRGVELQRPATGRDFRVTEHDPNLLAQLVDEDHRGAGF